MQTWAKKLFSLFNLINELARVGKLKQIFFWRLPLENFFWLSTHLLKSKFHRKQQRCRLFYFWKHFVLKEKICCFWNFKRRQKAITFLFLKIIFTLGEELVVFDGTCNETKTSTLDVAVLLAYWVNNLTQWRIRVKYAWSRPTDFHANYDSLKKKLNQGAS